MQNYNVDVKPAGQVHVSTGLNHTSFTKIDDANAIIEMKTEVTASWRDERLSWDERLNPEPVSIDAARVWHPVFFFENEYSRTVLQTPPVVVTPDGQVTWSEVIIVEAMCVFSLHLYPFDTSNCPLVHTTPLNGQQIMLDSSILSF